MLDHGVLNVPLAKRGDIDAQIDKYKAQQAKEKRAAHKAALAKGKADRVEAKRILAAILARPDVLDAAAARRGAKRADVVKALREIASLRPSSMPAFERDWLGTN